VKGGISMNESKRGSTLIFTLGLLLLLIFFPTLSYSKGESWQKVSGPWDQKFESSFGTIAVDPTNSNIIYLANEGGAGIYKSVDGGVSWHTANKGIPKLNSTRNYFPISGIFVNPHKPTTIYSSTATPFSADPWDPIARGVFKSKTGGDSWKKSNGTSRRPSLPKEGGGVLSIFRLVGDPNHPDTLYTGHAMGGIYKTADGGTTWLEKNNGLPKDPIFGLHVNVLEIGPSNTNTLYAAPFINYPVSYLRDKGPQPQGIYKTVDGGDHWARLDTGSIILPLPWDLATFVTSLKVSPHHSNTIYFGTSDKGIYKSTDGGNRWVEVNGTGDNKIPQDGMGYYQINCLVIDPVIPNTIYAGLNNGGVYKSHDGGANWSSYNNGLDAGIDVNNLSLLSDKLYATTAKGVYVKSEPPLVGGGTLGAVLQFVLGGIASGAVGEIGSVAMGNVLNLLGWGDQSHQQEMDALNGMRQTLDQIVTELNKIQNKLDGLFAELHIEADKILLNANNPKDAIGRIHSAHDELRQMAAGKNPGDVDKQYILDNVATPVDEFNSQMKQDVNLIKYAILPLVSPIPGASSVLDNYLNLALDQIIYQGKDPIDAYNAMELYFSQLLFYQLEGVNLVIEAKNAKQRAGVYVNPNAEGYWNDYTANTLKPQVDKFMENVYRMILRQVNLLNSSSFLPPTARSILSRANFFRVQSLNRDHYGLRGTLIATQDLVSSVVTINARNKQTGQTYPGTGTLYTGSGKTYDHWSGQSVKPSSDYTVVEYDFGNAPLGDYDILDGSGNVVGSATVQAYKDDYTVDPSGNIKYGHFTISKRIGTLDRFAPSEWGGFTYSMDPGDCATVSQSPFKVQGRGNCNGRASKLRDFIIGSPDPVRIYFSAGIYGLAVEDFGRGVVFERAVGYGIWLLDANYTGVHRFDSGEVKTYYPDIYTIELTKTLDPANYSFTFSNPLPGHTYSIFLELYVEDGCKPGYGDCPPPKDFIISIDPISIGIQY
jgi:photosystem II stability/assembly factor-like uncharacterized protein